MPTQFAYLQLYSRWSGFGGLPEVDALVKHLWEISDQEGKAVAAALTDTFSVAAYPEFAQRLAENGVRPLAGAEIILTIAEVPYSLLLYATSETGYANLCRIITNGWHKAANKPLLASVDINTLNLFSEDLIAIAPYYGGPITAATKASDAKYRASMLHGIFGSDNFYLGVPLETDKPPRPTGELLMETDSKAGEEEKAGKQKEKAALLKLSRDLKIGLVATGEARYLRPEDSRAYQNLRNRLQRALSEQLPHSVIQQQQLNKHDWFYSFNRPLVSFHLRPPAELNKLYSEADWPNALLNNIKIAQRCANWQFTPSASLDWLRGLCQEKLGEVYPAQQHAQAQLRLESELADIHELDLADGLRAAIQVTNFASDSGRLAIPRYLSGSLVAFLSGLSQQPVKLEATESFNFEIYRGGRLVSLEVASGYREQLVNLPDIQHTAAALAFAPAAPSTEPDLLPTLHPRQTIVRLVRDASFNLAIQTANAANLPSYGAQIGNNLPPGYAKIEIVETSGVTRLDLALASVAQIARLAETNPLTQLPAQPAAEYTETASSFERALTLTRLNWLKTYHPAAFYAAALTLSAGNREQTAKLVELVRQAGLNLLGPDINKSKLIYSVEDSDIIRTGLLALLSRERISQFEANRPEVYGSLEEFLEIAEFSPAELEKLAWAGAFDGFGKREDLAGAANLLAATSQALREWQAQKKAAENNSNKFLPQKAAAATGQLDFFALLPETPASSKTTPEKPMLPTLPEAAALSRLELWRKSFQALGFFTAEHPLWTLSLTSATVTDVSRNDPVPLERVPEAAEVGKLLIIAGLITAMRRIPIALAEAGQGEELTILQLEDFTGKVELLLPKDTPSEGVAPEEGQIVAAQARPVKTAKQVILVALALAPYPPAANRPLFPVATSSGELAELEEAEEDIPPPDEPPFEDVPPPTSPPPEAEATLFGFGEAPTPPKPEAATLAPGQPLPASSKGGGKNRNKPAPVRTKRIVHLTLPYEADPDKEFEIMNGLKKTLVRFSGEDSVILYLQQADGSYEKLEPQGIGVSYNPDFLTAVMHWVGTDGIRLEERVY